MRLPLLALCAALLPAGLAAQSYSAINRLIVVPLNNTDFEVIEARGEGPRGIWCAAASFALDRQRVSNSAEIYVKSPRGPSVSGIGRHGVVFTTNPAGLTPKSSYSVSVRQQGLGLPVGHAVQFCKDYLYEIEDIFP